MATPENVQLSLKIDMDIRTAKRILSCLKTHEPDIYETLKNEIKPFLKTETNNL